MNVKNRLQSNLDKFKSRANGLKEKAGGKVKEKLDKPVGLLIHYEIAGLFFWDDKVQEKVKEIRRLTKDGNKDEAVQVSQTELMPYIRSKVETDRRYQKKAKKIADHLESKSEKLKNWGSNLSALKILKRTKKRNEKLEKEVLDE